MTLPVSTGAAERLSSTAFPTGATPREGRPVTIESFGRVLAELVGQAAPRREAPDRTRDGGERTSPSRAESLGRRVSAGREPVREPGRERRTERDVERDIDSRRRLDETDDGEAGRCGVAEQAAAGAAIQAAGSPSPQESERAREVSARSTGTDLEVGRDRRPDLAAPGVPATSVAAPPGTGLIATATTLTDGGAATSTAPQVPAAGGPATDAAAGPAGSAGSAGSAVVAQDPDLAATTPGATRPAGPPSAAAPAEPATPGPTSPVDPASAPGGIDRTGWLPTGSAAADRAAATSIPAGGSPGPSLAGSAEGAARGDDGSPPAPVTPPVGAGSALLGQPDSSWSPGSPWSAGSPAVGNAPGLGNALGNGVPAAAAAVPGAVGAERATGPGEPGPAPVGSVLAGQLPVTAGAAAATGPSAPAGPPLSPYELAGQVAKHLTGLRTLSDGTHRTVLHLAPEHLGELTLTVDVRAGTVALAVSGQDAALAGLRDGLAQLRTALAEAGLDLGDVSMSTPDRAPDRTPERDPDREQNPTGERRSDDRDQPQRGGNGRSPGDRAASDAQDLGRRADPTDGRQAGDQRIDITV